ncbi:hypothetical protein KC853_00795 [Candidatus Saccharibacteria bacterium]|nr:hypothetical protein [Candidatus Saccharibacteria bacterium]
MPSGRLVPREVFIKSYTEIISNIEDLLDKFPQINVTVVVNDYNSKKLKKLHIGVDKDQFKSLIPRIYSKKELNDIIK